MSCIEWAGGKTTAGYGQLRYEGRTVYAHRKAYADANGLDVLTMGGVVLHSCDNPACCNAGHLTLSTHAANVEDKIRKGRNGRKLSWTDVEAMRAAYQPKGPGNKYGNGRQLREQYGINQPTFSAIMRGDLWKPELAPEVPHRTEHLSGACGS
jgi:hypothetical protein